MGFEYDHQTFSATAGLFMIVLTIGLYLWFRFGLEP